ncbi:hypothetical protein DSCO28_25910 [Desulfosarcina ovata subsp. sediminis]|uniref:Uncharacterized protein n=1 Tax=Desulfosarcina ovata subsp. sediminis TaxID=885957 RepID=A0A5K7ZND9_9BACT|nr:hypothetical protein [Desulfosarcina ovata]BBO82025.1 hypothetical protein DSCO28_25910 [Desulfosarcina ovata subsp. sediminis]
MDTIFICRDALANSLISNLVLAMEAKKAGAEVGVIFTEEALLALSGQTWAWSPLMGDRDTRMAIAKSAKKMDIPMVSAKDARQIDTKVLLESASENGVRLIACSLWTSLLPVEGKLPPFVEKVDLDAAVKTLAESKTVIGSL